MTRYSVQPRDLYLQKTMDFYLLLEIWVEMLLKNISKNSNNKYSQKLIMLNNLLFIHLKLLQKK